MSTITPPRGRPSITPLRVWNMVKTPLTLLALLAVLYFGLRWGVKAFSEPIPTAPPPPCVTKTAPELAATDLVVSVWNGSTERGRASLVGNNLKTAGFQLRKVGNTNERVTTTIIRGSKADDPNVKLVASFFKEPKIEADGRGDGTVDVLVGPTPEAEAGDDWAGMNKEAPPKIALPNGQACIPAPKPTASPSATAPTARPS